MKWKEIKGISMERKINAPFNLLKVKKIPRLTEDGKSFYNKEIRGFIGKSVPVISLSIGSKNEVAHVHVRLTEEESTTLFPNYFMDDIDIIAE